jgi:hypothetical protein
MSAAVARPLLIAAVAVVLAGVPDGARHPAWALPASLDRDADGYADVVEARLGSDPGDPAKTPENVAVVGSCFDDADNVAARE